MAEPSQAAPALAGELRVELHRFLSLEAPFLIPAMPEGVSDEEAEAALLEETDRLLRPAARLGDDEVYPSVSTARAVGWRRDDLEVEIRGFFRRRRIRASLTRSERRLMLRTMLLTREVDEFLKRAFDRKEIAWGSHPSPQKGFRSTGQEAIVGAALRLRRPPASPPGPSYEGDYIAPLIRDLGALLMFMPDPAHPMLVQYGKAGTPVGGRDLHVGNIEHGVLPPAAPLAIAAQTLVGMAHGLRLAGSDRVCVSFIGDGGSSLGEWHEAINFAAVQRLGMVFVIENNQWALGTHVSEQTRARRFALRAAGYGIPAATLYGNDPEEVAAGVTWAAERARAGEGPTLIELISYRRPGHAHHDDDRFHGSDGVGIAGYEDAEERRRWEAHDPVTRYQERLQRGGVLGPLEIEALHDAVRQEVEEAGNAAAEAPWPTPADYRDRVYAPRVAPEPSPPAEPASRRMSYDEAVRDALIEEMEADGSVIVLGEDVGGRYGGAFGVTRGLAKRFGPERCLNTPLAESAIVGCGVGAALLGWKPVVEMQFADFLAPGFNALVNNAAKLYWRWGRPVPLVVRLPYGGATGTPIKGDPDKGTPDKGNPDKGTPDWSAPAKLLGGGPFHSQCPEMWFLRTPGWKIVAPSTPADAKGLMLAAIRDPNPVIYLEAKGLYGFFRTDLREEVPLGGAHEVPLGSAAVRREGGELTVLTYGAMVWTALAAAERLAEEGVSAEVVDLRSLWPLDRETIFASVRKTGRALVLHEDTRRGGLGGELAALLMEEVFFHLDAPLVRVTAPDTPVPYSPPLEHDFLPGPDDVVAAARRLLAS